MFVSEVTEAKLTNELIDRILYQGISDTKEKGDCILVLGSIKATKYRVPVASKLYKAERANKIMLCGGKIRNFTEGKMSEAEHMYKAAIGLGVSKDDIIVENTSQNTVENFLYALVELQRTFWLNKIKRNTSAEGIERATEEVLKIVRCVKNGVIPDFEI